MYDICHPTYYNMSQLGCNDQIKLTTAFYVYMELCEVRRYWDVEYKYNEPLQLFYLEAKKTKNSAVDTFIPWPAIHNITLNFIGNIQHELEKEKFTFVFKEGDTTSVYYSICSGLIKPINIEETKILRQKERKKFKLENQISRNAGNLYERALSLDHENGITELHEGNQIENKSDTEEYFTPIGKECSDETESFELKVSSDSQMVELSQDVNNSSSSQILKSDEEIDNPSSSQILESNMETENPSLNESNKDVNGSNDDERLKLDEVKLLSDSKDIDICEKSNEEISKEVKFDKETEDIDMCEKQSEEIKKEFELNKETENL